ncbi:MAG: PilZ domain-containing protein [Spirochaetaceae bacterium]|jgi:c-di-GMP-binding flagellar brake protein YcgR|nr:PilZ domain-containing protein [Spirochaetaceae bacterium]
MSWFLLQTPTYFKEDDPVAGTILLVSLVAIIAVALISSLLRHGLGVGKKPSKGAASSSTRRFSIFTLYRIRKTYSLSRDQGRVLEYVLKNNGVVDAEKAVANPPLLDKHFKQTYKQIEKSPVSDADAQQRVALLFSTRNAIELYHNTSPGAASDQILSAGMDMVLSVNQQSYQTRVISSQKDSVLIESPRSSIGSRIAFARGTKVKLAFFTKTNKGFSFESQILDNQDTSYGPALLLSRNRGGVKAMTQRRFRRRQIDMDCGFFLVHLEPTKRNKPPKLTVEKRRLQGMITDLSIGGCAIKTAFSVPAGSRLKIEFDYYEENMSVAALGQILRINRSGAASSIMHIKFLKVPRKGLNVINALVYEYKDY